MSRFEAVVYGVVVALVVVAVATPVAWRALRPLPHARRAVASNLACIGVAGLAGLAFAMTSELHDVVIFSVGTATALQGIALLILLLFTPPQRP